MACENLISIAANGCENNNSGLNHITGAYIFDMEDIVVTGGISSEVLDTTAWTLDALDLGAAANLLSYKFAKDKSSYTSEAVINTIGENRVYNNSINLVFNRREAAKSKSLYILGSGARYLGAFVTDLNGKVWYFRYLQLTADTGGSGVVKTDTNNMYSITLACIDADYSPMEINPADFATLLATGAFIAS